MTAALWLGVPALIGLVIGVACVRTLQGATVVLVLGALLGVGIYIYLRRSAEPGSDGSDPAFAALLVIPAWCTWAAGVAVGGIVGRRIWHPRTSAHLR